MGAVVQSFKTNSAASVSISCDKPVGLAVGDMMLAIMASGGTSQSSSDGFLTLFNQPGTSNIRSLTAFYKVATSGDVAASSFTFSSNNGTGKVISIFRITGYDPASPFVYNSATTNFGTSGTVATIDPGVANSLFFLIGAVQIGVAGTFGTYSIATDDPTWAEQVDINQGTATGLGIATATRAQATATGTGTVTYSQNADEFLVGIISMRPVQYTLDCQATAYTLTGNNTIFGRLFPLFATTTSYIISTLSATFSITKYINRFKKNPINPSNADKHSATITNISKESSTWTNLDKSE